MVLLVVVGDFRTLKPVAVMNLFPDLSNFVMLVLVWMCLVVVLFCMWLFVVCVVVAVFLLEVVALLGVVVVLLFLCVLFVLHVVRIDGGMKVMKGL